MYIDTAGYGTELLFKNGLHLVPYKSEDKKQSEEIFAAIKSVLVDTKISDLDFIAVITGPGSFTGIRLGLSISKGFKIATNVPVFGIDRFKAVSISQGRTGRISLFAGNGEVYFADIGANGEFLGPQELSKGEPDADTAIDPKAVLEYIENEFEKGTDPGHLAPLYIKPHYAQIPK